MEGEICPQVVVQTADKCLPWEKYKKEFMSSFELGTVFKTHYDAVPLSSIVQPLFTFADHGGSDTKFFTTLSKSDSSDYFNDKIVTTIDPVDLEPESEIENSDCIVSTDHETDDKL